VVKLLLENGELKPRDCQAWAAGIKGIIVPQNHDGLKPEERLYDRTPLLWAAGNGHVAVVKLLLEMGAEIESKDRYDRTSLSLAAKNGHDSVVTLLLEKGAKLESKGGDYYGQTPLSLAAENGHRAIVKLLTSKIEHNL
jgi:ankyrin repeat protein